MRKNEVARRGAALAVAGALALACLAGCSDDSEEQAQEAQDAQAVLEKLDALQAQVDALEAHLTGEEDEQPQIVIAGLKSAQQFLGHLDEFEERVSAAAVAANSAPVPESADERPEAYFEAIAPLDELSADLALIEDAFITAYGKGTVNDGELWQLKARTGEIEDMIALAKDSLEFRMSAE